MSKLIYTQMIEARVQSCNKLDSFRIMAITETLKLALYENYFCSEN